MRSDFRYLFAAVVVLTLACLAYGTARVRAEDAPPVRAPHAAVLDPKGPAPAANPVPGSPTPVAPTRMAPPGSLPSPVPSTSPSPGASPEKAEYVGRETCLGCHEGYGKWFQLTAHSKAPGKASDGANECEACHGPGSLHVNAGGGPVGITNPARLKGAAASAVCNRCHEHRPQTMEWRFSQHANNGVACNQCHIAHAPRKDFEAKLLRKGGEPGLCYTCHTEVRAEASWPSHHPIAEGRLACSDCHNVHGAELTAYKDAPTSRELCLQCHAQYRGPFAQEHQPTSESCTTCHKPHGSFQDNLLVASEPFLCLRCHSTVHNQHLPANVLPDSTVRSEVAFFSRCSVCHQEVHGSQITNTLTR